MVFRYLSLLILFFVCTQLVFAQCTDGTEASCECSTATNVCIGDLDGYTFSMSTYLHPSDGPSMMCPPPEGANTTSQNPTWLSFTVFCTDITLELASANCVANPNSCGSLGIQAAVYSDCSLDASSAVECDTDITECINDGTRILNLTNLTSGNTYYLLVDGCCGSACDIEVTVIGDCSGGAGDPLPAWSQQIVGDTEVRASDNLVPYSINAVSDVDTYHWYVDGMLVASGANLTTYDAIWDEEGEYTLCVDISNGCNEVAESPVPLCTSVEVQTEASIDFELAYSGFSSPVDIANAGDDRLFIVEQDGYIRIIEDGIVLSTPFLDIDSKVSSGGDRGLLSLVFHPDFDTNGYFYVNYYSNAGNTIIARYKVSDTDQNVADITSESILFTIDQPFNNHNGGDLNFSPNDGYLYISMGDGGSVGDPLCYAQDSMSLLGKILRVDVDQNENTAPYYAVPVDNPFVGLNGALDEIYQIGLRNPRRFVFDDESGDLWIADRGQNIKEEVNYIQEGGEGGENFGWRIMEGTNCYDPDPIDTNCPVDIPSCHDEEYSDPLFEYDHDVDGGYSITGGYVLSGCRYPNLPGLYICTDYVSSNSWLIEPSGTSYIITGAPNSVSTYGVDHDGQIYLASIDGNIYRVNDGSIDRVLYIDIEVSPLANDFEALDSIIVSDNVLVDDNRTITLSAPYVRIAESVFLPNSSEIIVNLLECSVEN